MLLLSVLFIRAISVKRNIYSLEQLATLYFRTGRVDESLGLFEEIETMAPNTTETLIRYVSAVQPFLNDRFPSVIFR